VHEYDVALGLYCTIILTYIGTVCVRLYRGEELKEGIYYLPFHDIESYFMSFGGDSTMKQ